MITLDSSDKYAIIDVTTQAFHLENGVVTLEIDPDDYVIAGRDIYAVFGETGITTGFLSVVEGIVQLPITQGLVVYGYNNFQLHAQVHGTTTVEDFNKMRWLVEPSIIGTVPASTDVDIITDLVAQVTAAVDSLEEVEAAVEADALAASDSADSAEEDAAAAASSLSQLLESLGTDVCPLDVDGKIPTQYLPPLSINDVFTVADTTTMLLLDAQRGDCAIIVPVDIVTDSYLLAADDPTILANWKKLGVSYVAEAGHATSADSATNADKIDGNHLLTMTQEQYDAAVIDATTIYLVG